MWLPSPWDVRPMRGGLCGNKEFEEAAIEVRSESSKWVKVLVEGKLGRNNALKLACAKQAPGLAASCTTPGHGGCDSTRERAAVARRVGAALARVAWLLCLCSAAPKLAAGLLQH